MILNLINLAFEVYSAAIIIFVLLSWFPGAYQTAFGRLIARICVPYLRWFNITVGPIDLGPFVALIVLQAVEYGLVNLLATFGLAY